MIMSEPKGLNGIRIDGENIEYGEFLNADGTLPFGHVLDKGIPSFTVETEDRAGNPVSYTVRI